MFCIKFDSKYSKTYRIIEYNELNRTVVLSDKVGSKFNAYTYYANSEELEITEFGNKTINSEEQEILRDKTFEEAKTYFSKNNILIEDMKVEDENY